MNKKLVYHGSQSVFDKFDYSKIGGNATQEGVGFYLTDNEKVAKSYAFDKGYILKFMFKGTKELSSTKVTLSVSELRKFLVILHEKNEFLSNFGDVSWEGLQSVLRNAVNDIMEYATDDIDIVSGIIHAYGEAKTPLTVLYEEFGYDHSIVKADWGDQNIFLCFTNECIEYIGYDKYVE